jgi:hypothetical protein
MILPNISDEQLTIVNNLGLNNVIVDSVAGSGKTTTNIYIAKTYTDLNILLLTYNAKLKMETRTKIANLNIKNIEVHSYHSFCVKYYNNKCFTDTIIKKVILNNKILKSFNYDIIILDEAQDINILYFRLICKIYNDNLSKAKICILGDRYQSIYDFNGADPRFITMAKEIFNFNNLPWVNTKLSESFRITFEMAEFINNCLLDNNRIISNKKSNIKPTYIICDSFNDNEPFLEVKKYIDLGYNSSDIFILAPSLKNKNGAPRKLENQIKILLPNINIYVPTSDEEKLDDEVIENKLVFSTFHQSKGLERKVIIVFNFDSSYFDYYKTNVNRNVCPNELYVAATRALERISFIHHYSNDYLDFLNYNKLNIYTNLIKKRKLLIRKSNSKPMITSVTDLIRHLPSEIIDNCITFVDIKQLNHADNKNFINIPIKTIQTSGCESVSEINGISIPSYFELLNTNKMTIYKYIIDYNKKNNITNNTSNNDFIDSDTDNVEDNNNFYDINKIKIKLLKPDELLYIANTYNSIKTGYLFKSFQIKEYNWLSQDNLNKCVSRLSNIINLTNQATYERYVEIQNRKELLKRHLVGYIDCIDINKVYELKCVSKLENEHILQLAIYMYIYENQNNNVIITNKYYLYNILSDELVKIKSTHDRLKQMIEYLIDYKYNNKDKLSDEKFLNNISNNIIYGKNINKL